MYQVIAERAEREILTGVLEIIRYAQRSGGAKTLRQSFERQIRRRFAFDWVYCPSCDEWLPPDRFDRNPKMLSGCDSYCKDCRRARKRIDFKADPERYRAVVLHSHQKLANRLEECYQ